MKMNHSIVQRFCLSVLLIVVIPGCQLIPEKKTSTESETKVVEKAVDKTGETERPLSGNSQARPVQMPNDKDREKTAEVLSGNNAAKKPLGQNTTDSSKQSLSSQKTKTKSLSQVTTPSVTVTKKPELRPEFTVDSPAAVKAESSDRQVSRQGGKTDTGPATSIQTSKKSAKSEVISAHDSLAAVGSSPSKRPDQQQSPSKAVAEAAKNNEIARVDIQSEKPDKESVSSQTQLAMLEKPSSNELQTQAENAVKPPDSLNLTLDQLPYSIGGWVLERNWDNQHPEICRLRSERQTLDDGYDTTYLWAEILPNEINIYTGSNIDLTYEGSGLQIGAGTVQPFSGFLSETAVTIAGDFNTELEKSDTLTVFMGFWPTWPKTETRKVNLSTGSLPQAMLAFKQCQLWSD